MGRPAGKIPFWSGQPVNAPLVTAPLFLRVFHIIAVLNVVLVLFAGVFSQLGNVYIEPSVRFLAPAILGFLVLPILISKAIATNWPVSRPLIALYLALMVYHATFPIDRIAATDDEKNLLFALALVVAGSLLWWLYRNAKVRLYYALVSGKQVPEDLADSVDSLLQPGTVENVLSRVGRYLAPVLEWLLVVIVLVGFYYMLDMSVWEQ